MKLRLPPDREIEISDEFAESDLTAPAGLSTGFALMQLDSGAAKQALRKLGGSWALVREANRLSRDLGKAIYYEGTHTHLEARLPHGLQAQSIAAEKVLSEADSLDRLSMIFGIRAALALCLDRVEDGEDGTHHLGALGAQKGGGKGRPPSQAMVRQLERALAADSELRQRLEEEVARQSPSTWDPSDSKIQSMLNDLSTSEIALYGVFRLRGWWTALALVIAVAVNEDDTSAMSSNELELETVYSSELTDQTDLTTVTRSIEPLLSEVSKMLARPELDPQRRVELEHDLAALRFELYERRSSRSAIVLRLTADLAHSVYQAHRPLPQRQGELINALRAAAGTDDLDTSDVGVPQATIEAITTYAESGESVDPGTILADPTVVANSLGWIADTASIGIPVTAGSATILVLLGLAAGPGAAIIGAIIGVCAAVWKPRLSP